MSATRERAALVAGLRRLAQGAAPPTGERCELCGAQMADEHRHLLELDERRILCACEPCFAMRGGQAALLPVGTRRLWLEGFELSDERWAALAIPVGLAFFLRSGTTGRVVALYPSPAGATECELALSAWEQLRADNPILDELQTDVEALIVDRIAEPPRYAIVPIDECYRLVGMIKASWQGISGGDAVERSVGAFFADLARTARRR